MASIRHIGKSKPELQNIEFQHDGRRYQAAVLWRPRRTWGISVRRDGHIEARVPLKTPLKDVEQLMDRRASWIARHVQRFELHPPRPALQYTPGELHLFLGQQYPLRIVHNIRSTVELTDGHITAHTPRPESPEAVAALLREWYRNTAKRLFPERLQMRLQEFPEIQFVPDIKVRALKSRWGSLSAANIITLNLELARAPMECIDYVLTHELCHVRHRNHGKHFYTMLESRMPQWRSVKARLEQLLA